MSARLIRALLWLFRTPKSCELDGCTETKLCDDCAAFWGIK